MNKNIQKIDFNSIKQNLLSFFKSQDRFSGYNFEGSGLNILVDILAYNTYYQMFYNNMTFNEMFLDTATKRSSVVSLAKMLGYTPASAKAPTCKVNVITNTTPTSTLIPKYTIFRATYESEVFEFVTLHDYYLKPETFNTNGTIATLETGAIEIKEGKIKTLTFIHDEGMPYRKYTLPFDNIDLGTIEVNVQESQTDSDGADDVWEEGKEITKITGSSNVYFIEETPYGQYCVYFGDGVIGKKLKDANQITVKFLVTNGLSGNGIGDNDNQNTFTIPALNYTVDVLIPAAGGDVKETKESIKLKAPKSFTAQERAVTLDDYKNIVLKDFPNIKSVSCWGGEDNDPPQYGKVFLSVKPQNGSTLTNEEKISISNSLKQGKNIVGIDPIVVDPEVIYLLLDVLVKIDPVKLKISTTNLLNKINKQVLIYVKDNIEIFDGDFFTNELVNQIDSLDESIYSINVVTRMEKRIIPDPTQALNYEINFRNTFNYNENCTTPVINSSSFYYYDPTYTKSRICILEDDSNGKINIVYNNESNQKIILKEIGTVDYVKGIVYLKSFQPVKLFDSNPMSIYAAPKQKDIFADKNNLLSLDNLDSQSIKITVEPLPYRGRI